MHSDTDYCTWLHVPYARKDEAKALGARWDRLSQRWYVPRSVSLIAFRIHGFLATGRGETEKAALGAATSRPGHPA